MIKKEHWMLIALGLVLIVSLTMNGLLYKKMPRTAFVDIHRVFEEFDGQKEMTGRLSNLGSKQKMLLDSMAMNIRALQAKTDQSSPQAMLVSLENQQRNYMALNSEFTQQYEEEDQKYSEMVWKQINQYVTEFGEENGYDYIYGASGNGALMYASNQEDITQTILEYINQKYEGI